MTALYQCALTSQIEDLPSKTEFLRCSSRKILEQMFDQCFNFKGSMYFGYDKVKITIITLRHFPEVKQIDFSLKLKEAQKK